MAIFLDLLLQCCGRAPDVEDFIGGYGGSIVHSDEDHLLQCFLANASSQSCGSQGDGPHRSCEQLRAIIGTGARGTAGDTRRINS